MHPYIHPQAGDQVWKDWKPQERSRRPVSAEHPLELRLRCGAYLWNPPHAPAVWSTIPEARDREIVAWRHCSKAEHDASQKARIEASRAVASGVKTFNAYTGGPRPVAASEMIFVRTRDGKTTPKPRPASEFDWAPSCFQPHDIVGWRRATPEEIRAAFPPQPTVYLPGLRPVYMPPAKPGDDMTDAIAYAMGVLKSPELAMAPEKKPSSPLGKEANGVRGFDSGATRSSDAGRYDPEGFMSPIVIERFCEYMNKHRVQPDGSVRDSDNWQKGIPVVTYMKGLWRHTLHLWTRHRGHKVMDPMAAANREEDLCAILFNAQGMLYELLKDQRKGAPT